MWSHIINNLRVQIAWDQHLVQPSCEEQSAGIPRCSFQDGDLSCDHLYTYRLSFCDLAGVLIYILKNQLFCTKIHFNLLAPELFFFNFSITCILNLNNAGTKYVRIMKLHLKEGKKNGEYISC